MNEPHLMRKPTFCLCENKGADQLCDNRAVIAELQRLSFRYIHVGSTILSIHLLLLYSPVCAGPGRKPGI